MKSTVPQQHEGKQLDHYTAVTFDNEWQAKEFYETAKTRLLHPYEWYRIATIPASTFTLTDCQGVKLIRKMRIGDLIRIDIPGPGSSNGEGYDWVLIEEIIDNTEGAEQYCSVTVRPTSNPENDDPEIAHFFKGIATSTFLVKRAHLTVQAEYHGRNEVINLDADKWSDRLRNMAVGLMAKIGLSSPQWKGLIEGFVDTKTKKE